MICRNPVRGHAMGKLLNVSPRTVEAHRARLMKKLGVATATELVQRLLGVPR
ncbi:MAG: hypothetical protein C0522_04275 [Rhodocyclaceae bacterium]|nr:hypothetical protein [Rhodocyclaceae bacterium]